MIKELFSRKKKNNPIVFDAEIFDAEIFDAESHRNIDENGRLNVAKTLITKGCVSPYWGQELPGWQELGLEPNTRYMVYRPAEELRKVLPKFENIPLMSKHIMDYADEGHKQDRAGSLSNVFMEGDSVYGDVSVWDKENIASVENGSKKGLSVGYQCKFVKEPGEYNGQHYDLKMVDIIPNHLALVKKGRVDGAHVYDEDKEEDLDVKSNGVGKNATPKKEQKMDKREIIREIMAISAKPVEQFEGGEEEKVETISKLAEKLAYKDPTKSAEDAEPATEPAKTEPAVSKEDLQKIKDEAKEEARREMADLCAAKDEVERVAGKISVQDSKEKYFKLGCEALGLKTEGVADSAFEPMFRGAAAMKKSSSATKGVQDGVSDDVLADLFKNMPKRVY